MGSISKRRPYFPYLALRKVSGFGLTAILGINTNACFGQSSLIGLGDLPGGGFQSVANDVSADGTVVVGSGSAASRTEAVRWTSNGGMQNLSDQANGFFSWLPLFRVMEALSFWMALLDAIGGPK